MYKEFMSPENQANLRDRLFKVVVKQKVGLTHAAKDINIAYRTIRKFLVDAQDLEEVAGLSKIEDFVLKNED